MSCNSFSPNTYGIQFNLFSDNFCAQFVDGAPLQGSLTTFQDSSLQTPQQNFLYGQPIYFKATVIANSGPVIVRTTLNNVEIKSASVVNLVSSDTTAGFLVSPQVFCFVFVFSFSVLLSPY